MSVNQQQLNDALLLHQKGKLDEAQSLYSRILENEPEHADALHLSGVIDFQRGDFPAAIQRIERALRCSPSNTMYQLNLGNAYHKSGHHQEAIRCFQTVLASDAKDQVARCNLANVLRECGQTEEAITHLQTALVHDPEEGNIHNSLGVCYYAEGQYELAASHLQKAIQFQPEQTQNYFNLANALRMCGKVTPAVAACERALADNPASVDVRFLMGQLLWAQGKTEEAFAYHAWRFKGGLAGQLSIRITKPWQGESLTNKTLLILAEPGLGDTLYLARLFPFLRSQCQNLVVECDERLVPLFERSMAKIDFVSSGQLLANGYPRDYEVAIGDLWHYYYQNQDKLAEGPYLKAETTNVLRRDKQLHVGLSWRSFHPAYQHACVPLISMRSLLELPGAHFELCQYGDHKEEVTDFTEKTRIPLHHDPALNAKENLDSFAAKLASLDVVISVDNSTLVLATALGVPCVGLLSVAPNPVWGTRGDRQTLATNLKLFRQELVGEWQCVVGAVRDYLMANWPIQTPVDTSSAAEDGRIAIENRCVTLRNEGNYQAAIGACQSLIEQYGETSERLTNLAILYQESEQYALALETIDKVCGQDSQAPAAIHTKASILRKMAHYPEAIALLESISSDYPMAQHTLSQCYLETGDYKQAEHFALSALQKLPGESCVALQLANVYHGMGALRSESDILESLIRDFPPQAEAYYNRAFNRLLQGELAAGFQDYEWRFKLKDPVTVSHYPYPRWQGESLQAKTLLILCEPGVGDSLVVASLFHELQALGGKCVVEVDGRFIPLFERSFKGMVFFPKGAVCPVKSCDYQIPMMSLYQHFRRSTADFKSGDAYLKANETKAAALRSHYQTLAEGPITGIAWRTRHQKLQNTNLEKEVLCALVSGLSGNLISLQYGDATEDLSCVQAQTGREVHHDTTVDPLQSIDDFAAQVAAMDRVVTIDNSTLPMAGSLGIQTHALLSYVPHPLWQMTGETTPFFDSVTFHRQVRLGDWQPALQSLFERLS